MFGLVPFKRNNINSFGDEFDNMMDNFFNDSFFAPVSWKDDFNIDLKENEKEYLVTADLPGVDKKDINVEYNNNHLIISAKREDNKEEKDGKYIRKERNYGEMKRTFYIDNIEDDKINAKFENGVLKLVIPKEKKEIKSGKKIEIK